jgi:hypothetical protein
MISSAAVAEAVAEKAALPIKNRRSRYADPEKIE